MTIEEAIEIMTNAVQTENYTVEQDKALALVQKACEKQIPEKPIKCSETKMRYSACFVCRSCGGGFSGTGIAKYCYHCGQALDWSENNG